MNGGPLASKGDDDLHAAVRTFMRKEVALTIAGMCSWSEFSLESLEQSNATTKTLSSDEQVFIQSERHRERGTTVCGVVRPAGHST